MPTDNVVPIDAEVARSIARRAVRFRWFVAGLTAVWLGALIPVLLFTPLPPLVPFLVLGALLVLAEHRFVLFGDETSMSGSIIVAIASVFVFIDTAPLAGPMLVASLGGLYFPHLRRVDAPKILTNSSAMALGALGACLGTEAILAGASVANAAVAAISVAAATYWVINNAVVAGYVATRDGVAVRAPLATLASSDANVLVWCSIASAIALSSGRLGIQIAGVAACLGANALASGRSASDLGMRASADSDRLLVRIACWSLAVAGLVATGAAPTQVGVLAGSGVAYALWSRSHTTAMATASTVVLTLVAVGSLDRLAQAVAASIAIIILCAVKLGPSSLRGLCVLAGALAISALAGGQSANNISSVTLFACVASSAVAPQMLGAVHGLVRARTLSVSTLVAMGLPSTREALLVVGCFAVVAALGTDPRAGIAMFVAWLAVIIWIDGQRVRSHRSSAVASR